MFKVTSDYLNIQEQGSSHHPLVRLPREDQDLIAQLVLNSGSLKDLAASYGVSYPTIRARLDRVIERLRALIEGRRPDPVSELLASLVQRGEMSVGAARAVRELVRNQNSTTPGSPGQGGDT
jgi:hypothetical protein